MAAANERKAVGVMHIGAAALQRDILLAGIDEPAVDRVGRRRRPHPEHAVLGMENDFALGRHVVGDLQRRADAEIDVPALRNVARQPRRHFGARQRLVTGKNVHQMLRPGRKFVHVTVGSP